ncbi:MAG: hypothetical protein KDA80_20110 [Planctomycetaceae bacterium]|nr:hypothetical protein [Planctomycetaceae bacterium]
MHPVLHFSNRIQCLPVVHGSGDFAVAVREILLNERFDCVAVPLPPSTQPFVERGITHLPNVTVVLQQETEPFANTNWSPGQGNEFERVASFVPIDPCQPVIAALRLAMQEHIDRRFIDLEVEDFEPQSSYLPDPYALKRVSVAQFATAVLPAIRRPRRDQHLRRISQMAARLHDLEHKYESILFVCSLTDWPWIREAYQSQKNEIQVEPAVYDPELYRMDPETLVFLLGELPFIASLYEETRFELDSDENLSVDGVKQMLLSTREKYQAELGNRGRKITPHLLSLYLKYVRNLSLIECRLTPDLYTLVTAAQQIFGDQFAISLAETAREYQFCDWLPYGDFKMSIGRGQFPDGGLITMKNRLEGPPVAWRSVRLNRKAPQEDKQKWAMQWNPFSHCSWPPEDVAIERFRTHVKDKALSMLGNDLARIEKFTTSLKDGLDIRETLRNWHTGDLYVKENPPSRGQLDCVLMLFDSPADPRDYPWRITWHAEHDDESTLSFFATDFHVEHVGPGIAMATYGGAMFLFPPRPIRDIWRDGRFDFVDTLEERLLVSACHHSQERHIAVLSQAAPGMGWRRLAKKYGKQLLHVPLAHFSQETVQQLRMFHVLNGRQVRSYAEHFIRKA